MDYPNWRSNYFRLSLEELASGASHMFSQQPDFNKILICYLKEASNAIKEVSLLNKALKSKHEYQPEKDDCVKNFLELCQSSQNEIPLKADNVYNMKTF